MVAQARAPRERSIVCSAGEVRGLIDGRVSLLVRPIKPQPRTLSGWAQAEDLGREDGLSFAHRTQREYTVAMNSLPHFEADIVKRLCPFAPSEHRRVRETWAIKAPFLSDTTLIAYRADGDRPTWKKIRRPANSPIIAGEALVARWRAATQMPAWASRLSVEMGTVRIARLHDLTEEDAQAAGADREVCDPEDLRYEGNGGADVGAGHGYSTPRSRVAGFARLWDQQHGKRWPWDQNCWCWLIGVKPQGAKT